MSEKRATCKRIAKSNPFSLKIQIKIKIKSNPQLVQLPDSFLFQLFSPPKETDGEEPPPSALEHLCLDASFELSAPSIWVRMLARTENATADVSHTTSLFRVAFLARRKPALWSMALSNPSFGLAFDGHPALLADLLPPATVARLTRLALNPYNWSFAPESRVVDLLLAAHEPLPDLTTITGDQSPPPIDLDAALAEIQRLLAGDSPEARRKLPQFRRLQSVLTLLGIEAAPVIRREIALTLAPRSAQGAAPHLFAFLRAHGPSLTHLQAFRVGFSVPLAWTDPDSGAKLHLGGLLPRPSGSLTFYESLHSPLDYFPPTGNDAAPSPVPSPHPPKALVLNMRSPPTAPFSTLLAAYLAPTDLGAKRTLESVAVAVGGALAPSHAHDHLLDQDLEAFFAELFARTPPARITRLDLTVVYDPHSTRDFEKIPPSPSAPADTARAPAFLARLPSLKALEAPFTPACLAALPLLSASLRSLTLTPPRGLRNSITLASWADLAPLNALTSLTLEAATLPTTADPLLRLPSLRQLDLTPVHALAPEHAAALVSVCRGIRALTLCEVRTAASADEPSGTPAKKAKGAAVDPATILDLRPLCALTSLELVYPSKAECPIHLPASLRLFRCEGEGSTASVLAGRLQRMLVFSPDSLRRAEVHINREFAALQFADNVLFKTSKFTDFIASSGNGSTVTALHFTLCLSMENVGPQALRPLSAAALPKSKFPRLRYIEIAHNGATDGLTSDQMISAVADTLRDRVGPGVVLRVGYEGRTAYELALEKM